MKDGKFNIGIYAFAGIMGMIAGGLFSRSQYYLGQADAYDKMTDELAKVSEDAEKALVDILKNGESE